MANDALSQQALAADPIFRLRVKSSLAKIAWQILSEDPATANHQLRKTYALQVLANLDGATGNIVGSVVMRTNLFAAATSVSLVQGRPQVLTAALDADIDSQLATDWSALAGV